MPRPNFSTPGDQTPIKLPNSGELTLPCEGASIVGLEYLIMRITILFLTLLAAAAAAPKDDISQNPSVILGDETLYLASVEAGPDVVLNEYIRKTETFANWKVLFAVRYVRSAKSVDEVVNRWKAYLAKVKSPGMSLREDEDSSSADRRFTLAIRPLGDAFLETNTMRFIRHPNGDGVIYYQAAVRVNPRDEGDLMQGFLKQGRLARALASLSLQPAEEMPSQPAQPNPGS
ncbi:MAG: hypothetical protein KIT44_12680 [Opitutaceae bacterium]|nr:hypothetical protein [Opitutaceae bacterium]